MFLLKIKQKAKILIKDGVLHINCDPIFQKPLCHLRQLDYLLDYSNIPFPFSAYLLL